MAASLRDQDLVADGVACFNAGRWSDALRCFHLAARTRGDDARLHCFMGHCHGALGDARRAAAEFSRALRLAPGHAPASMGLAGLLRAQGRPGDAARLLRRAWARRPRDAELREALALSVRSAALEAKKADRLEAAQRLWRQLAVLRPADPEAARELEENVLKQERQRQRLRERKGGARAARRLRAKDGAIGQDTPSQRSDRFRALAARGRYEEAFALGERILDQGATLTDVRAFWYPWEPQRVPILLARHLRLLRRLSRGKPRTPWPLYLLGALSEEEIPGFDPARGFPARRYGWMFFKVGHLYLIRGKFRPALSWLSRAARHQPLDWRVYGFLAETRLCLGGSLRHALRQLENAARTAPPEEKSQVTAWRGALYLWSGRYEQALRELDLACAQGALWAHCWRAGAKIKLGRHAEALKDLEKAIEVHPGDREARVWRCEALRELGRYRQALRELPHRNLSLWGHFNRGLVYAKLKDREGLRSDFRAIHDDVLTYVKEKMGKRGDGPLTAGEMEAVLRAGLDLGRGYRHSNYYGNSIWMK